MRRRAAVRGGATLAAVLMLTMLLTLAVLYLNRGLLFEQRSAANQARSAQAAALAQGGIEWMAGMLNDPTLVDDRCEPSSGGAAFRDRVVSVDGDGGLLIAEASRPSCSFADGLASCRCGGELAAPGDTDEAGSAVRFMAAMSPVAGEAALLRVQARGCVGGDSPCTPGEADGRTDATARAGVVMRWLPGLRTMPVAALTAGGAVQLGGGVTLAHRDATRGGTLVHAGGGVTVSAGAALQGPPGTPVERLVRDHDATLAAGDLAVALLGTDVASWRRRAAVHRLSGSTPSERGAALRAAHAQGYQAFHAEGDVRLEGDQAGTADRPLLLVTAHRLACERACRFHGLVFVDGAVRGAADLQHVTVHGAVVTRQAHTQASGGAEYNAPVLERLRLATGVFVPLPGTWSDE